MTQLLFQDLGSHVAAAAVRRGQSANALTLTGLALSLLASVAVLLTAHPMVLASAWMVWLVAYVFDCADGQLARYVGTSSPRGATLDAAADFLAQIATASALGLAALTADASPLIVLVFVATRPIGTALAVLGRSHGSDHQRNRALLPLAFLVDHPVQLTLAAATVLSGYAPVVEAAFIVLGGLSLLQVLRIIIVNVR